MRTAILLMVVPRGVSSCPNQARYMPARLTATTFTAFVLRTPALSYFSAPVLPAASQEADASFTALYEMVRAQVDLKEF